jgi:hypothetical protein
VDGDEKKKKTAGRKAQDAKFIRSGFSRRNAGGITNAKNVEGKRGRKRSRR